MIDIEIATERSSFLAPEAAPVAIAAEVPQTEVAADKVITRGKPVTYFLEQLFLQ